MSIKPSSLNRSTFQKIYRKVMDGPELLIRGQKVKECRNVKLTINSYYPITSFVSRELNLNYAKKEVLWYLRGNRFDTSICEIAGAWNDIIQPDGGINSNYGQTIFQGPNHFNWVVNELINDINSRRAVIILGEPDKLKSSNTDHRCTMYINYHIRNMRLYQSVYMRSNDLIYGLTNDVFFFGILHQMIHTMLKSHYLNLELGEYYHNVDSLHVYEKHYKMLENIIKLNDWFEIDIPKISNYIETILLRHIFCHLNFPVDFLSDNFQFIKWIRS